jgi:hypothetical protein
MIPFYNIWSEPVVPCTNYFTSFDGINEWQRLGTANLQITRTTPTSFNFWIKAPARATQGFIFSKRMSTNVGYLIGLNSNGSIYYTNRTSGSNVVELTTTNNFVPNDTWTMITLTKGNSGLGANHFIYVNGVLCTTNVTQNTWTTNNTNTANFNLATFRDGLGGFLNCYIDEFAQWGTTNISQASVTALYNLGRTLPNYAIVAGLTRHFRMDVLNSTDIVTGGLSFTSFNQDATNILCD